MGFSADLSFSRKSKLGIYLINVAKLWEAMDTEAEERLLQHGLDPQGVDAENSREPALHIRRTLDQSYFLNLDDTTRRDRDQVVYRATRLPWHVPGNLTRVVMVDQLWMWILDDCKHINSCISFKLTGKQTLSSLHFRGAGDGINLIRLEFTKASETG